MHILRLLEAGASLMHEHFDDTLLLNGNVYSGDFHDGVTVR